MSSLSLSAQTPGGASLRRLWNTNPSLVLLGIASLALLLASVTMALIDPRTITGAPAWAKPIKFAISSAFYAFTLAWMLGYVRGHPRLVGIIGSLTSLALAVELILIVLQVVRGVRSHFNYATPLDASIFSIMAIFILLTWVMGLLAVVLLLRQPLPERAFAWSLRLGLIIAMLGAAVAFLMTRPTPPQMERLQAGDSPTIIGAHSVGVEDGGSGLPLVGWSTQGGDLRVAHFFGLHALQVIPLAGLAINRLFRGRLSETRRTALVWTIGAGYLGWVLLLTWQALRGQSVVAPDGLTLAALAILAAAVLGGSSLLTSGPILAHKSQN